MSKNTVSKGSNVETLHEHSYKLTVVPPTCTKQGYTLHKCDCGYEYKDHFVKPQHNFQFYERIAPTCQDEGKVVYKCTGCGEERYESIPATEHSFGGWKMAQKPTCHQNGVEERECRLCGEKETRYVNKLEHEFGEWETVSLPTCLKAGIKERKCRLCGESETITIAKTEHRFGKWVQQIRPSCTEDGVEERQCVMCGVVETRSVKATGHSFSSWSVEGNFKTRYCENCGLTEQIDLEQERIREEKERKKQEFLDNLNVFFVWALMVLGAGLVSFGAIRLSVTVFIGLTVGAWIDVAIFDWIGIVSVVLGVGLSIASIYRAESLDSLLCEKYITVTSAVANAVGGVTAFCGVICLPGTSTFISGLILTVVGAIVWVWSALLYNDGDVRIFACSTAIASGSLMVIFGSLYLRFSAIGLGIDGIGIAFILVGLLLDKIKEDRTVGSFTAIICGTVMAILGALWVALAGFKNQADFAGIATGLIGIGLLILGTCLGDGCDIYYYDKEVRPIGAFISVIYGTLLALLGAIMIYCSWRMSVSVLAGILCLIVGVGVNVFGTCHDSFNVIFNTIICIIAVCLGVAIASIFILAPTNDTFFSGFIIAMGIAGLFVGAIPFGTGLSRMDDEDTMGIVATLSCLVVFAVFIYKIIAGCSAM